MLIHVKDPQNHFHPWLYLSYAVSLFNYSLVSLDYLLQHAMEQCALAVVLRTQQHVRALM